MKKHKALFLDRDGIVNKMILYEYGWDSPQKPEDVRLTKGIEDAILWANKNKVLVIEITNQPGVAKGKMSLNLNNLIEKIVQDSLKEKKVNINKVYTCLHHPHAVINKYRKECNCRKPKIGLLLKAAKENNVDLKRSVFLGDSTSDIEAGNSAGCKTILLFHKENALEKVLAAKNSKPDYKINKLIEALPILKSFL